MVAALAVLGPLGYFWLTSLVPSTYDMTAMGRPDSGGGPDAHRHGGLSVADLDAWIAKLRGENVKVLEPLYKVGDTRAIMIEGPSHEAIELVEVK